MSGGIPRPFDTVKSVAIIGAGITGLTLAFYLKRQGIPVALYEASGRVGGVIGSIRRDGFLAESGPNTLLETTPQIAQLIRDAGIESRKLPPDSKSEARYVVRYQRTVEMPATVPGFLTTNLFSLKGKLAFMREPFIKPRRDGVEESIGQFVLRRFSREFLDQAIDALVSGIYAGDPAKLSLTHAFPKLKALEDTYGSMIRGQVFGARARKKSGEIAKDRAPKYSFDEGLQVLPDALAAKLGENIHLDSPVTQLTQTPQGWQVECSGEIGAVHDLVVYCGTAYKLADLKIMAPKLLDLTAFSEIRHPPVSSVVLGFRRSDVAHPCNGFGMLIPKIEGFKILGTIFSSSLFPNRAPEGCITLTSYVGGERAPELARLPEAELVECVLSDLRKLLGVRGKPIFIHTTFWPKAIPQYNVGFGKYRDQFSEIEKKTQGLFFAGHFRDGVSLSDSIMAAIKMAARIAELQT